MKLKLDYVYDNFEKLSYEEMKFVSDWYRGIAKNDFTRFMEKHDKDNLDDEEREKLLACAIKRKVKAFIDSNKREDDVLRFLNKMNYNQWDFMDKDRDYIYISNHTCNPDIINKYTNKTLEVKGNKRLTDDTPYVLFRTNHIDNVYQTDFRGADYVVVVNKDLMRFINMEKPIRKLDEHHYVAQLEAFTYYLI